MSEKYVPDSRFDSRQPRTPSSLSEAASVTVELQRELNDLKAKISQELQKIGRVMAKMAPGAGGSAGGTGGGAGGAGGGFDNPMTEAGDLIEGGADGEPTALHAGAVGAFLRSKGPNTPLEWDALPTQEGQVLYARDGITFEVTTPLCGGSGWLSNDEGILLYPGGA